MVINQLRVRTKEICSELTIMFGLVLARVTFAVSVPVDSSVVWNVVKVVQQVDLFDKWLLNITTAYHEYLCSYQESIMSCLGISSQFLIKATEATRDQ